MALAPCPECGREVSSRARACPGCGYPLDAVTVERTGKAWKALQLGGGLAVVGGIVTAVSYYPELPPPKVAGPAVWAVVGGLALYLAARIGAWWHHG